MPLVTEEQAQERKRKLWPPWLAVGVVVLGLGLASYFPVQFHVGRYSIYNTPGQWYFGRYANSDGPNSYIQVDFFGPVQIVQRKLKSPNR